MRKKIFIPAVFIFLYLSSFAQNIIRGKVVDAISRQPLQAVSVSDINQPLTKTITDQEGNFSLKSASQVLVSYIGYKAANFSISANNKNIIALQPAVLSLKDIVLQTNTVTKFSTVSKIDLDLKPVRNTQELLLDFIERLADD